MNNKSNLLLEFHNGKVILPLDIKEDITNLQKIVNEFEAIDMGSNKKLINYGKTQYTVQQFLKFLRSKLLTPEQRDILDLQERVGKLEEILLNEEGTKVRRRIKTGGKVANRAQEAIRNFHARIESGEEKANRIKKIVEIAGLSLAPITKRGFTSFGPGKTGEIRCFRYIEDLYDGLGEEKLSEILTALSTVEDIHPKQAYFIAIRYAIETKKMSVMNAVLAGENYFKEDFGELTNRLRVASDKIKEQTGIKPHHIGLVLGKVLTGEVRI